MLPIIVTFFLGIPKSHYTMVTGRRTLRAPFTDIDVDRRGLSFLPPFSHTSLSYLCFASQMVLLGFHNDSSLFTSPVTSIHAGACDDKHCERERVHMVGVPKRIGAQ